MQSFQVHKSFIFIFILLISFSSAVVIDNTNLPLVRPATSTISGNLTNFTELTDTPSSYAGQSGQCTKVNTGETGLEFGACGTGGGGGYENQTISYNAPTDEITLDGGGGTIDISEVNTDTWNTSEEIWVVIDNGTFIKTETDPEAYNGTLAFLSDILGWNYYNSTDFLITDYYLKSNPFGFYNSTNPQTETDPLWSANYTNLNDSWSLNTQLNLLNGSNISISETGLSRTINVNMTGVKDFFDTIYSTFNGLFTALDFTGTTGFDDLTDDDASTICSGDEVLLGNGTCVTIQKQGNNTKYISVVSFSTSSLSTADLDISMDGEIKKDSIFTHTPNSTSISFSEIGTYLVMATVKTKLDSGTRGNTLAWIEVDDGSGFSEVDFGVSQMTTYNRESIPNPYGTGSTSFPIEVTSGTTTIKMVAKDQSGNQKLVKGSSITITKINTQPENAINDTIEVCWNGRNVNGDTYLLMGTSSTAGNRGFVMPRDSSILSLSISVAPNTVPFGGGENWSFVPTVDGTDQEGLRYQRNITGGFTDTISVDYGNATALKGSVVNCYAEEETNGIALISTHCCLNIGVNNG